MSQQAVLRPLRHWPWLLHFHHHHHHHHHRHHATSSTKFSALYHHLLLPTSSPESTNIRRFSLSASRGKLRRADSPLPTAPEEEEEEDAAIKSRNQLKREAKRAVKWGMDLSSFSPPQIKRILKLFFLHSLCISQCPSLKSFNFLLNFVFGLQGGFFRPHCL